MARRRTLRESNFQPGLFDLTLYLKTAACVPALRKLVAEWREKGYAGSTPTTRMLLNYWFLTDHKLPNGRLFTYLDAQREAIETLIYVYEVAQVRTRKDLLEKYAPANSQVYLPAYDEFARYCTKMATGSGKTKVMSLAIVWHYLNAVRENEEAYAKTFLIIAPNVIVYERLEKDLGSGRIFEQLPLLPPEWKHKWNLKFVLRGRVLLSFVCPESGHKPVICSTLGCPMILALGAVLGRRSKRLTLPKKKKCHNADIKCQQRWAQKFPEHVAHRDIHRNGD